MKKFAYRNILGSLKSQGLLAISGGLILVSCGAQMGGYSETDGVYYDPNKDVIPEGVVVQQDNQIGETYNYENQVQDTLSIIEQNKQNQELQKNKYKNWNRSANTNTSQSDWGNFAGTQTNYYSDYGWSYPYGFGMNSYFGYGAWNPHFSMGFSWGSPWNYYGYDPYWSFGYGNYWDSSPYYYGYYGYNPYYYGGYYGYNPYYYGGYYNNNYYGNGYYRPNYRRSGGNGGNFGNGSYRNSGNRNAGENGFRTNSGVRQNQNQGVRNYPNNDQPRPQNNGVRPNSSPRTQPSPQNIPRPRTYENNSNWGSGNSGGGFRSGSSSNSGSSSSSSGGRRSGGFR